jgi:hypothetical protein
MSAANWIALGIIVALLLYVFRLEITVSELNERIRRMKQGELGI